MNKLQVLVKDFAKKLSDEFDNHNAVELCLKRSKFCKNILKKLWHTLGLDNQNLTLLKVGGFGRDELFPYSDLDMLILSDSNITTSQSLLIEEFIATLWNLNLKPALSVRSFDDCLNLAQSDVSIFSNLLDASFIEGNQKQFNNFYKQLLDEQCYLHNDFLKHKITERKSHYQNYQNNVFALETDIKNGVGAIRDLNLIEWIVKKFQQNLLSEQEITILANIKAVFFNIRFALHLQTNADDNRLNFDNLLLLAKEQDNPHSYISDLMSRYFKSANYCYFLLHNLIATITSDHNISELIDYQPYEVFSLLLQKKLKNKPLVLRSLSVNAYNGEPLSIEKYKNFFLSLFEQENCYQNLKILHQTSILPLLFPDIKAFSHLMQFNRLHSFTVDEHSLQAVKIIDNLSNYSLNSPVISNIALNSDQKFFKILRLAMFFHDLGKGYEEDHCDVGVKIFNDFAKNSSLSSDEKEMISFLIKEHLTLSLTAQRCDIYHKDEIAKFAQKVKNKQYVTALFCLTFADMNATYKGFYNSWKDKLFTTLYHNTMAFFDEQKDDEQEQVELIITKLLSLFNPNQQEQLQNFIKKAPLDYVLQNHISTLQKHCANYLKSQGNFVYSNFETGRVCEIFIYTNDRDFLFLDCVKSLSQAKFNILEAQILTVDNKVFDRFVIEDQNQNFTKERLEQIKYTLTKVIKNNLTITSTIKSRRRKKSKSFVAVDFRQDFANASQVLIKTWDYQGTLARICEVFSSLGITIKQAKIASVGEMVEDFFVIDYQNNKLTDDLKKEVVSQLSKVLC